MPTKKTTKLDSKISKIMEKNVLLEVSSNKDAEKDKNIKKETKKVVVKRRKTELKPTKASAVAIASQANRAKKQALIKKLSNSEMVLDKKDNSNGGKIPLWVWVFFGCSLMLFCISFYQAIIRPQIEQENIVLDETVYSLDENVWMEWEVQENLNDENILQEDAFDKTEEEDKWEEIQMTVEGVVEQFFVRLSDRDFDGAFDLMIPALRNYNDIRTHFSAFRMNPFLEWIEWWKLMPENLKYINSPSYWKDAYEFDLSYVLKSNQEKYDETWEFTVNTLWDEPKISSIRCVSSKCSYHPIFWPENFGLMK